MMKKGRSAMVVMSPEARVLRSLREKKGWSMRRLAQELGYSDSYISQIENGRENPPRGDKLIKFLSVYDISPKYFGELVRNWQEEKTDADIIGLLLPKLKPEQTKLVRTLVEQLARGA